jgi:spore germination protein KC
MTNGTVLLMYSFIKEKSSYMKLKKMSIFILTLAISLLLTGCWDHNEVNKLAIVVALGIDKIPGPEPFLVSAQIVNPATIISKESGSKGKPFFIASVKGSTLSESIHKFMDNSPRRFFFSHTAIIVLGDKLARSEFRQTLDYFARERQFRRSIWVLVTPKTAQEILQSTLDLEKIPGLGIEGMILQSKKSTVIAPAQRKDLIRDITSKSHSAVISRIDLISQKANEAKGQKNKTEGATKKGGGAEKRNLQLRGEGVFNKDKLVGYLTDTETRGMLWILGKMKAGPVIFRCQKHKNIVLNMNSTKSQITPSFKDGKLKVSINIQTEGIIKDLNCPKLNVSEIATIKKLEKHANGKIEQDAKKSIQKAQHLKSDIFGVGNQIYRDHPKDWANLEKNWDQKFSQAEVEFHVTSIIRRLGVITEPLEIEP